MILNILYLLPLQSVHLKGSAIELLDVMLEETDENSKHLVRDIAKSLDIEALHHTLVEFYELMNDQNVKKWGYDDEAEKGLFRTYHALIHITDYGISAEKIGKSKHVVLFQLYNNTIICFYCNTIEPKLTSGGSMGGEHISTSESETLQEAWEFCKRRSKSIEVLYENMNGCKILTRVHFNFDPDVNLKLIVIIIIQLLLIFFIIAARASR